MPVMLVTNVHPDVMKANRLYDVHVTLKRYKQWKEEIISLLNLIFQFEVGIKWI